MSERLRSKLFQATSSTFELLGFLCPEDEIHEWQQDEPLTHGARVSFAGPVSGRLDLHVTDEVGTELAANMLGLFSGADISLVRDAVGEVANVICGNLVPAFGSEDDVFDLTSPVALEWPWEEAEAGATTLHVGVDEGRAVVTVTVEEAA